MSPRISFDTDLQVMHVDFSDFTFADSPTVNMFYDRLEAGIAATGTEKWFFLVNLTAPGSTLKPRPPNRGAVAHSIWRIP